MIAPRAALLWGIGLWIIPLNLGAVIFPNHALACLIAMAPFVSAAILDAWLARKGSSNIRISLPDTCRFTLGRTSSLRVTLRKLSPKSVSALLWIDFPATLAAMTGKKDFRMEANQESAELRIEAHPIQRGLGEIRRCRLEMASPLGLWTSQSNAALQGIVKVYPNLVDNNSSFASPENQISTGAHRGLQIGKGWEFEKLREYIHGDDYHDIHWKATARKGFPVTKIFKIENTQQVYVILDISRFSTIPFRAKHPEPGNSNVSVTSEIPLEIHIQATLRLGLAAERQGDYYGLMLYGEQPSTFLRAGKGKVHYGMYRDALYNIASRPGSPDYPELFSALRLQLKKRALLLFFCDLQDPALAESFQENIALISRQHLVSVNMIRPPGIEPLFGLRPIVSFGDVYESLADQLYLQNLAKVGRSLKKQGVAFQAWDPARFSLEAVSQYLEAKKRRALG